MDFVGSISRFMIILVHFILHPRHKRYIAGRKWCIIRSTFTISKMTADPTFEEKMYQLLLNDGIAVEVEGSEYYER